MATTCRRSATGVGPRELDVPPGYGMTDARSDLNVLALNSGSSSLKFGLYRVGSSGTEMLLSGEAEAIGEEKSKFRAQDGRGDALLFETISVPSQLEAIVRIGKLLAESSMPAPAAIGHRIVHGGPRLRHHCIIDDSVLRQLEAASAFTVFRANRSCTSLRRPCRTAW
jgi:acetate kinase